MGRLRALNSCRGGAAYCSSDGAPVFSERWIFADTSSVQAGKVRRASQSPPAPSYRPWPPCGADVRRAPPCPRRASGCAARSTISAGPPPPDDGVKSPVVYRSARPPQARNTRQICAACRDSRCTAFVLPTRRFTAILLTPRLGRNYRTPLLVYRVFEPSATYSGVRQGASCRCCGGARPADDY